MKRLIILAISAFVFLSCPAVVNVPPIDHTITLSVTFPETIVIENTTQIPFMVTCSDNVDAVVMSTQSPYITISKQHYNPSTKTGFFEVMVKSVTQDSFTLEVTTELRNEIHSASKTMTMYHDNLIHFEYEITNKVNFDNIFPITGTLVNNYEFTRHPSLSTLYVNPNNYYTTVPTIFPTVADQEKETTIEIAIRPYHWEGFNKVYDTYDCITNVSTNITGTGSSGYCGDTSGTTYSNYNWGNVIKEKTISYSSNAIQMYLYTCAPLMMFTMTPNNNIWVVAVYDCGFEWTITYTDRDSIVKDMFTRFKFNYPIDYEAHLN